MKTKWNIKAWVCVLTALSLAACGGTNVEDDARAWAAKAKIVGEVTCSNFDTDNDGYYSCTIFKPGAPVAIECSLYNGCRQPKVPAR